MKWCKIFVFFFLIVSCSENSITKPWFCKEDSDCFADEKCDNLGHCSCVLDVHCNMLPGFTCRFGSCHQSCQLDGECAQRKGYICREGLCRRGCSSDAECRRIRGDVHAICRKFRCELGKDAHCYEHAECVQGLVCGLNNICRKPDCIEDTDCKSGKLCDGGFCVGQACREQNICLPNEDCRSVVGRGLFCDGIPGGTEVKEVRIVRAPKVLKQGHVMRVEAIALNSKHLILKNQSFTWTSSDKMIVKAGKVEVTGGHKAGRIQLIASVGKVRSKPVSIQNFLSLEKGKIRLILLDQLGKAVGGAKIQFKFATKSKEAHSGADGALTVEGEPPFDLHIMHPQYTYLSIFRVEKRDLLVQLTFRIPQQGTVKGKFSYSDAMRRMNVLSVKEWSGRGSRFGVAGLSLPEDPLLFHFDLLLGQFVKGKVMNNDLQFPGAIYGDTPFGKKLSYQVHGLVGRRILWGFAHKITASEILNHFPHGRFDGPNLVKVIGELVLSQKNAAFGYKADIDITPGSQRELNLAPDKILARRQIVQLGKRPTFYYKKRFIPLHTLTLIGTRIAQAGIVPLGLKLSAPKHSSFTVEYADPNGRLRGGKLTSLVLAFNFGFEEEPPLRFSARIQDFDKKSEGLKFADFLSFPNVDFAKDSQELKVYERTDADFLRLELTSKGGQRWHLLFKGDKNIKLPKLSAELGPPWSAAFLRGVKLKDKKTLQTLIEFNQGNMTQNAEHVEAFNGLYLVRPTP